MEDFIFDRLSQKYQEKEDLVGADIMRQTERMIMLQVIDDQWKDHLLSMDHLKEGIGLRGYGQKDPLVEYKKESYILFQDMMDRIEDETIRYLFFLQITQGPTQRRPCCRSRRTRTRTRKTPKSRSQASPSSRRRPRRLRIQDFTTQHPAQKRKGNGGAAIRGRRRQQRTAQQAGDQRRQGRPQRSVSLRQRKEIQEVSRILVRCSLRARG